jgi:5-hydroxyisourate hydrolase
MITTHVLDLARGVPGAGIAVTLEVREAAAWSRVASGTTDRHGRLTTLTEGKALAAGTYRLTFDVAAYHREHGITESFFPEAQIAFNVRNAGEHFHVPLLLSPFGYSTYRGS